MIDDARDLEPNAGRVGYGAGLDAYRRGGRPIVARREIDIDAAADDLTPHNGVEGDSRLHTANKFVKSNALLKAGLVAVGPRELTGCCREHAAPADPNHDAPRGRDGRFGPVVHQESRD